ncbi:MAG: HlyD family efflux transporter periplasmic adaptor subunit [Planctomycetaceae bacterium]|nr:HlyD family efflux transporter periplasmic adaptor subunit [Planctomycetaceae bacterium]
MFSHSLALILCSLLQSGDGAFQEAPTRPLPIPVRQPRADVNPSVMPGNTPVAQPIARGENQLFFQNALIDVPKHNHVIIYSPERAALMSLNTEQRDAEGNILQDAEGNPVMVPVRRGMFVFKGQRLGHFENRELHSTLNINRAQLEVARAEQEKEIEAVYAAYGVLVSRNELQMIYEGNLRQPGLIPRIEVERAQLALAQSEANLELQKYTLEEIKTREVLVRESELERTKTQIEIRNLVSPIDGMIVNIHAAEGEWKREGEPILEIMNLDTVLVTINATTTRYRPSDLENKHAVAHVRLPNGSLETFPGRVVFCSPVVLGHDMFQAFVEIQNRRVGNNWLLQRGLTGVDVLLQP